MGGLHMDGWRGLLEKRPAGAQAGLQPASQLAAFSAGSLEPQLRGFASQCLPPRLPARPPAGWPTRRTPAASAPPSQPRPPAASARWRLRGPPTACLGPTALKTMMTMRRWVLGISGCWVRTGSWALGQPGPGGLCTGGGQPPPLGRRDCQPFQLALRPCSAAELLGLAAVCREPTSPWPSTSSGVPQGGGQVLVQSWSTPPTALGPHRHARSSGAWPLIVLSRLATSLRHLNGC